jgi:hypothetical protein
VRQHDATLSIFKTTTKKKRPTTSTTVDHLGLAWLSALLYFSTWSMIGRIQAKLLSGTPRSRGFLARPISSNWLSRCYATSDSKDDSQEMHRLYQEQMLELKEERDLLFGFTGDEVQAWTGASASSHTLDESLLADINEARQAAFSNKENDISEKAAPSSTAHISQGESPRAARLSHVSDDGNSVSMVNVGAKVATRRVAVAQSRVVFPSEVAALFRSDRYDARTRELSGPKGPIFQSAKIAGIMAAK